MILEGCPGAARLKTPTLEEKICPVCGNIIEIFSVDTEVACERCGFVAYNDALSCAQWCNTQKNAWARSCTKRSWHRKTDRPERNGRWHKKLLAIHPMG